MPRDFEAVLRFVWSAAPTDSKLDELERLSTSTGLAEHWRLHASSLIPALHAREGRAVEAAASYRKLFADFRNTITENPRPSYLQLTLAFGESLLLAAESRGLEVRLLDLRNSGDTAGSRDQVVGYGAFGFIES